MHSLTTATILERDFARNERKPHVNFCQNGKKSCLHIYEGGKGTLPYPTLPPVASPLILTRVLDEFVYS